MRWKNRELNLDPIIGICLVVAVGVISWSALWYMSMMVINHHIDSRLDAKVCRLLVGQGYEPDYDKCLLKIKDV